MTFKELKESAIKERNEQNNALRERQSQRKNKSFNELKNEALNSREKINVGIEAGDVNNWFKSVSDVSKKASEYFSKDGYKRYDNEMGEALQKAISQSNNIEKYIKANRNSFEDYEKTLSDFYDTANYLKSAVSGMDEAEKFYSEWDSAEEYNKYVSDTKAQNELREKMLNDDLSAVQAEISEKQKLYDSAKELKRLYDLSVKWYDNENAAKYKQQLAAIGLTPEGVDGLNAEISNRKQYYNSAKNLQENQRLSSVGDKESENYDADFEKYVIMGKDYYEGTHTKSPSQSELPAINFDQKGYSSDNVEKTRDYSDKLHSFNYSEMNDDERALYHYYLGKAVEEANGGAVSEELAEKYEKTIQDVLNYRHGEKMASEFEDSKFLQYTFSAYAGIEQFSSGIKNLFSNEDYIPTSATQYASGMVREDLEDDSLPIWYNFKTGEWEDKVFGRSTGQLAYDLINTTANMAPSILASAAVGTVSKTAGVAVGASLMGASSAGNAYQEMLNAGYDKSQARVYSTLVGGSEAALSYALGGISKLGGKISGNVISKAVSGVKNGIAKFAIQWGGKMLSEGLEEGLQEVLDPLFKNLVFNTDENVNWEDVAYSALLGAMSAGVLEGPSLAVSEVGTYLDGKSIQAKGKTDVLVKFAKSLPVESVANKLAGKVNEKTGAYTIGRILHESGAALSETNKADIVKSLERKGVTPKDARTIAKWLNKAVEGESFSDKQVAALEENEVISKTFSDIVLNSNSTVNQRMYAFDEITGKYDTHGADASLNPTSQDVIQNVNEQSKDKNALLSILQREYTGGTDAVGTRVNEALAKIALESNLSSKPQNALESKFEASEDGQAYNKKTEQNVNVFEIASIKDGKMKLKLDSGETVDAEDIEFATEDEAVIYSAVLDMGVDAATANAIVKNYDSEGKLSASQYIMGVDEAYRYGYFGIPAAEMSSEGFSADLDMLQRSYAYELGRERAKSDAAENQKKIKAEGKKTGAEKGTVHFDGSRASLTKIKKESLKGLDVLAKVLKKDFHIYESYVENGKRVYKDANGKVRPAPNGKYYQSDGSIWIDINAGNQGQGIVLHTAAHELTHFIKQWSPEKFKVLADFLCEQYGEKGVSVDSLVKRQQQKAQNNGREISYEEAFEEFVADSMSSMLNDGTVIKELCKKDMTLGEKIKSWIDNILKKLQSIYKNYELETEEGKFVSQMTDSYKKIQSLFAEALSDASENFANADIQAQKNTTDNGDVKSSDRDAIELNESTLENLYSYSEKEDFFKDSNIYSYDFLINQRAMRVLKLPMLSKIYTDGKIDRSRIISEGKKNALSQKGSKKGANDVVYVKNKYTNKMIEVNNQSIRHGIGGKKNYMITNARLGLIIGDIIRNSIPINELKPSLGADSTYAMVAYAVSPENKPFLAISHIDIISGKLVDFETVGTVHSLKGRMKKGSTAAMNLAQGLSLDSLPFVASEISITQLLEFVNHVQQSILSEDVLARIGETRKPEGTYYGEVLHSDRDYSAVSNRSILADALESATQNDIEKAKLAEYKSKIDEMDKQSQKLTELRQEIKELSFSKGPRDKDRLRSLQDEAIKTANRIDLYDKQLLRLEAAKPLQNVLEREKQKAAKRQKAKDAEILKEYKEKSLAKLEETRRQYQESRKRNVEGRQKTELRNKIKKTVKKLNHLLIHGSKEHNIKIELQGIAREAILTADQLFDKDGGESIGKCLSELRFAYDSLAKSESKLVKDAYNSETSQKIHDLQMEIGKSSLSELSKSTLEKTYDCFKLIYSTITNVNKLFKDGKAIEINSLSWSTINEIEEIGTRVKNNRSKVMGEILDKIDSFSWAEHKPVYAFERIGSKTLMGLYWDAVKADGVCARNVDDAATFMNEQKRKYGYIRWDLDNTKTFVLEDGKEFKLTLSDIMSIYAYSKREQAHDHIIKGGFMFTKGKTFTEGVGKNKKVISIEKMQNTSETYRLNVDILAKIVGSLTEQQRNYVDSMQDYLSSVMGEKGNEVSRILYGIDLFKEKHYFPLKSSTDFLNSVKEALQKTPTQTSLKNIGMAKETTPHASNPIMLESFEDVWKSHVIKMSQYNAYVIPIENLQKVFNFERNTEKGSVSVKNTINRVFGENASQYVDNWIIDLNGGMDILGYKSPLMKRFATFKKVKTAASLSTTIQQYSAVVRATALVDSKYFVSPKRLGKTVKFRDLYKEMREHAPIVIVKEIGGFDVGSTGSAMEYMSFGEYDTFGNKFKGFFTDKDYTKKAADDMFMAGATAMDKLGWMAIWSAVKNEIAAEMNMPVGSKEFFDACSKRFTEVIAYTQVYDSVVSRSGIMRSKGELNKFATAFMGEPTTSINMLLNAALQVKRAKQGSRFKAVKNFTRVSGAVYGSIILAAISASFIYALRDDEDEDESLVERWAWEFGGKLRDEINPLNMLPYARDIISIIQGYTIERPDMSLIADVIDTFKDVQKALTSEPEEIPSAIMDLAQQVAALYGIPLGNIIRDTNSIINGVRMITDDIAPSQVGYAFSSGWRGEENSLINKSYAAFESGDYVLVKENVDAMIALKVDNGTDEKEAKASVKRTFTTKYKKLYQQAVRKNDFKEMTKIEIFLSKTGLYGNTQTELYKWRKETEEKE